MANSTHKPIINDSPQDEPSLRDSQPDASHLHSTRTDSELETLRHLILGNTIQTTVEKTFDSPVHAESLSRILPEALARAATEESDLARALRPMVEAAIEESVRTDEKILAEYLFPVIGPSTRKSISSAIGALVQSLNQTLEYSVSPKSIGWRIEAFRTGKTFAEVVMVRTLAFQVEQVLLIHKETGLLLQHRVSESVDAQDPDLVSAMLTAIEDFVQDSFSVDPGETLDTLELGDIDVWIEEGPHSILACVVRGTAPAALRERVRASQEKVQKLFGPAMETFEGDTSELDGAQPYLDDCLYFQYSERPDTQEEKAGLSDRQKAIAWVVALFLTIFIGIQSFLHYQHEKRWHRYIADLSEQPGLVVIEEDSGKQTIRGLRDPLAADPANRLATARLDPSKVKMSWEPYWSLDPEIAGDRDRLLLGRLRSRIASRSIVFQPERAAPRERYRPLLSRQVEDIALLVEQASAVNKTIKIAVVGYGDRIGETSRAVALGAERADYIKRSLVRQGISATAIETEGGVVSEGDSDYLRGTAVFKVDFTR